MGIHEASSCDTWKKIGIPLCLVVLAMAFPALPVHSMGYSSSEPLRLLLDAGPATPRSGGGHHGHAGASQMESEHRPTAERRYRLNHEELGDEVKAHLVRPDGEVSAIDLGRGEGAARVVFETPLGDDRYHGANSVYVIDRRVEDGVLWVRTAKWITLHHSCRWGHDHKFTEARQHLQPWDGAPLELLADPLWDSNFHIRTMAGDSLRFRALLAGEPVANARLLVESGRGWSKWFSTDESGSVEVQLIRDYYPDRWSSFRRNHRERLNVTAHYEVEEQGEWNGEPYSHVRYVTTLPWKYAPARSEYTSYGYGLILAAASALLLGSGIFLYRLRRRSGFNKAALLCRHSTL